MALPERHVYHLSPERLFVLPAIWLGIVVFFLFVAFGGTTIDGAAIIVCLMVSVIMLPFVGITWQSRLVLTPDGIAHHQFGYTVRSTWANVASVTLAPPCAGLILKEPGVKSLALRLSMYALGAYGLEKGFGGRALEEGRFIALQPFLAHWKRGPLREDVARWAPHLKPAIDAAAA